MKDKKAIALVSGGLDSLLSVVWMQKLGYEVISVFFETPFFPPKKALTATKAAGIDLQVINFSEEHIEMLKNPIYGFGKNLNPCIDCHGLMFKHASRYMEEVNAHFIISGEVLGQRPMSQRMDALNAVRKLSGIRDLIIRPLCQKLLPDTKPIKEGWVDKNELLDISGRGRKRQIELAKELNLTISTSSGGGCLLTEKNYCKKLKDLFDYDQLDVRQAQLLKLGRQFRINENMKMVVGKEESDNDGMERHAINEILMIPEIVAGPMAMIIHKQEPSKDEISLAASILLSFTNKAEAEDTVIFGKKDNLNTIVHGHKMTPEELKKYHIM